MSTKKTRRGGLSKTISRARNVMRLMTGQRFTPPYEANYSLHSTCLFARLRHYPAAGEPKSKLLTPAASAPVAEQQAPGEDAFATIKKKIK